MSPMQEKVLIIGSGSIGKTIARSLLKEGVWQVLMTSRSGSPADIPGAVVAKFDADLSRNAPEVLARVRAFNPDVAILAFGKGVDPDERIREVILTNAFYPVEVAGWLHEHTDCRCLLQLGSCFDYGHSQKGEVLSESSPPRPFNVYGSSKLTSLFALEEFSRALGHQVFYLRPFSVFGPGEPAKRLSPTIFDAALDGLPAHFSDGLQQRDFVYADDVGRFVVRLLGVRNHLQQWHIFNICSGRGMRIKDFVLTVANVLSARFKKKPPALYFDLERKWKNEPESIIGDPAEAQRLLGWTCEWQLEEAICDYFQQYIRYRMGTSE